MRWAHRLLKVAYIGLIATLPIAALATNYAATQGSGITFGSLVVSAVNYAQFLICDPTTPTQCLAVNGSGQQTIANTSFTANAGTNLNTSALATTTNVAAVNTTLGSPFQAGGSIGNTTFAATQATGTNLHAVLDTTSTTAVTQATGTNLHTVVDSAVGLAQGSTTSGQTGSMIMGAVTTSPPTNTTAQTAYASLATTGGLRVAGDGTKLLVTPDSVALPANQSVNLAQVAGATTPVGSGVMATAPRIAIATDSPGIITLGGVTTATSVSYILNSQYPVNSVTTAPTPKTGNATGSTGAVVGTLAAVASVTNFICGFNVSAIGGTAAVGPVTIAGLIGSSQVYQANSSIAGGVALSANFNPCIPASAVNTAITVTTTADGTATAVDVNSWGYQL